MANAQLELACRVGSREAIEEAIEEGGDINFGSSTPLITAILAGDRPTVEILVELGADVSVFTLPNSVSREPTAIVDALMATAPGCETVPDDDPVDAKLVRAFDRMIRNKGLAEPIFKKRGSEFRSFCDGLKWIAAEECHAAVSEFLEKLEGVEAAEWKDCVKRMEAEIEVLTARYQDSGELPSELLKEYLKERKKLTK